MAHEANKKTFVLLLKTQKLLLIVIKEKHTLIIGFLHMMNRDGFIVKK